MRRLLSTLALVMPLAVLAAEPALRSWRQWGLPPRSPLERKRCLLRS